jgi:hypothetical protein
MRKCSLSLLSVWVLTVFALGACGDDRFRHNDVLTIVDDTPKAAETRQSYPGLAPIAPPKPMYEQPPVLQNPTTTVWRTGYWSWNGSSYAWVPGEVIPRPAPTAMWYADHWIWHTYGWAFVPGYWE